jgi:cytochrome c oxidase subunit 2
MDIIPGRKNAFEVTPDRLGTFSGKCAELCGVDHSRMLFDVKVVTRAEYDAHIAQLKAINQSGKLHTGRTVVAGE